MKTTSREGKEKKNEDVLLFTLRRRFPLCSFLFRRLELPVSVLHSRAYARYKTLCSIQVADQARYSSSGNR
ncbi:hypothetical protein Bca101_025549 [Brassica carinata]